MSREVDELKQRVDTLVGAQGAQFSSILAHLKGMNDNMNANNRRIEARFDKIEEALSKMQNVLETVSALIYRKFGDHPDANHERFE